MVQKSDSHPPNEADGPTLRIAEQTVRQAFLDEISAREGTGKLNVREREQMPLPWRSATREMLRAQGFTLLPREAASYVAPRWLIRLEHITLDLTIGIEVASDVVIGVMRSAHTPVPDLDLSIFGGLDQGVSRRHAMIRPSQQRLYLLDLHSTNGTCLNGLPVKPGFAVELKDEDILTVGALSFTLHIVATPSDLS